MAASSSSFLPSTDEWLKLLSTYEGRDKLIRTSYYALLLITGRMKHADGPLSIRLMNLAKQLSAARMVGRRFNDLAMIKANIAHFREGIASSDKDKFNFITAGAINVLYLLFHPVEHIAWLSSMELLAPVIKEPSRWWTYTVWIWATALVFSILRSIKNYGKLTESRYQELSTNNNDGRGESSEKDRALERQQTEEMWNLVMYVSDLIVAVNYLPKGILWSQTLPQWKIGSYGLIASMVGLVKLFQRLRS